VCSSPTQHPKEQALSQNNTTLLKAIPNSSLDIKQSPYDVGTKITPPRKSQGTPHIVDAQSRSTKLANQASAMVFILCVYMR